MPRPSRPPQRQRQRQRFDGYAFAVRFGCGFLMGGLITGYSWLEAFVPAFLIGGILWGLLAWKYGDRFWAFASRWLT